MGSLGIIILLFQNAAFAGSEEGKMTGNGGASFLAECFQLRGGTTTLKVKVTSKLPISYFKFDAKLDNRQDTNVEGYFAQVKSAEATTVIKGRFKSVVFSSGMASGINLINFHSFEQQEATTVSCK